VFGLGAQLIWTIWSGQRKTSDWPIPGWPQSYVSQIMVKTGNDPELGLAGLRDIPARVEGNFKSHAAQVVELLAHVWVNPFLGSPAVIGVITLIALGLSASLWKGGGQLHDWYFVYYEVMYLLWPWDLEIRF